MATWPCLVPTFRAQVVLSSCKPLAAGWVSVILSARLPHTGPHMQTLRSLAVVQLQEDIEDYISMIEIKFGYKFPEGRDPDIQFMAHLWEPLRVMHKPLAMVLTSESVSLITDMTMFFLGFRVQRCQVHAI